MSTELNGKTALITGASRGIGHGIALRLAAAGANVIVNYRSNDAAAQEVVRAIEDQGGKTIAIKADIARLAETERLFSEAEKAFGGLDIVVANAGTAIFKPLAEVTEADYEVVFGTNTKGALFTLREAARRLRDGGRIVAISTGGTRMFFTDISLYLGSKGAVEQFVRVLSRELGPRGITVNSVLPGFTNTDLLPQRDRKVAAEMSPLNRVGEPDDIAEVVAFLASAGGRWVTGQTIGAGGGVM